MLGDLVAIPILLIMYFTKYKLLEGFGSMQMHIMPATPIDTRIEHKLNLNTKTNQKDGEHNYEGNGKQLSDIKFIFVIRDCEEYRKSNWLETQKNDTNRRSTDSLRSMKSDITSIEQLIGEPIYFPMPSAFDSSGAPNIYFSEKCIESRQIISNEIEKVQKNSSKSYYRTQDLCFPMISICDHDSHSRMRDFGRSHSMQRSGFKQLNGGELVRNTFAIMNVNETSANGGIASFEGGADCITAGAGHSRTATSSHISHVNQVI